MNPDENLDEDEFYFKHAGEHPTMEEFRAAQHPSGYPLRLPIGLKKLRNDNDPKLIRSFTTILGSLMQGVVDYIQHLTQHSDSESWEPRKESKAG